MDTNGSEYRYRARLGVLVVVSVLFAGCGGTSGDGAPPPQAAGGTGGGAGGSGGNAVEVAGAPAAGGGGSPQACPGKAPAPVATTGRVDLPIQFMVNQSPMTIGTPAAGRTGLEYKFSAFELFLAEPAFFDANGQAFKGQIVASDGKPLPYGIQLVDADDPTTQSLHLAVPQGNYTSFKLGVGVPAGCNAVSSTDAVYPLNPDSQMFWTWGSQFLFIRVEGAERMPPATDFANFFHHVGYDQAYTHLTLPGTISVGASGTGPILSIDLDLMLAGSASMSSVVPVPSGSHDVPDGWVVDNLETQPVFTLR